VALLVRRLRERLHAESLVCIGTSAAMSSAEHRGDSNQAVANVASRLFGATITAQDVIGETLERVTDPALDLAAIRPHLSAAIQRES
jgi:ATP-dependent helicase YprA (DUF1998 family)